MQRLDKQAVHGGRKRDLSRAEKGQKRAERERNKHIRVKDKAEALKRDEQSLKARGYADRHDIVTLQRGVWDALDPEDQKFEINLWRQRGGVGGFNAFWQYYATDVNQGRTVQSAYGRNRKQNWLKRRAEKRQKRMTTAYNVTRANELKLQAIEIARHGNIGEYAKDIYLKLKADRKEQARQDYTERTGLAAPLPMPRTNGRGEERIRVRDPMAESWD